MSSKEDQQKDLNARQSQSQKQSQGCYGEDNRKRSSSPSQFEPPISRVRTRRRCPSPQNEPEFPMKTLFPSSQSSRITLEAMELDSKGAAEEAAEVDRWSSAFSNRSTSLLNSRAGFNPSLSSKIRMKQRLVDQTVERDRFRFMRPLDGHESCVNAIAFSPGQGRYLASAGDDMRVHIRDVLADIDSGEARPLIHLTGHRSNIFSLSWSCDGTHLFSGGNDDKVLFHDVSQSSLPSTPPPFSSNEALSVDAFLGKSKRRFTGPEKSFPTPRRPPIFPTSISHHEDSVKEVSAHPTNPFLVLSCNDSGEVFLTDVRTSVPKDQKRQARAPFSSCLFNPNLSDGNTFAASTNSSVSGSTCLYDLRSFFSGTEDAISRSDAVVEYASVLQNYQPNSRGLLSTKADVMSLAWSPDGTILSTNVSLFKPTLYGIGDPLPLAALSTSSITPHLGTSSEAFMPECGGYHSGCTVKHSSFGKWADELFFASGSDDFRGYGWKIPSIETLKEMREVEAWRDKIVSNTDGGLEDVYYVHRGEESGTDSMRHLVSVLPTSISTPHFTLEGAKSITNSVQCHPTLPMIATSGVERLVRLYSCIPLGDGRLNAEGIIKTRKRYRIRNKAAVARALVESLGGEPHESDEEEGFGSTQQDSDDEVKEWEDDQEQGSQEGREDEEVEMQEESSSSHSHPHSHEESGGNLTHYQHHLLSLIKNGHNDDESVMTLFDELIREEEGRRLFDKEPGTDSESESGEDEGEGEGEVEGEDEDEGEGEGEAVREEGEVVYDPDRPPFLFRRQDGGGGGDGGDGGEQNNDNRMILDDPTE